MIGIGRGSGSLPSDIFASRKIARIPFNFGQVMAHTQTRGKEPINRLYPDLTYIGAYSAWSWGVSRLIDGLELVQDDLPIDLKHLAVTGCSFAGKMALFAGAFDERIALTIAQESGGGGAAAWRVSETLGNVETLGNTSSAWFIEDMFRFANNVPKLPYDHHELMAMVAPRALLVLGNPDYEWLADESGYVSCRAAHEVWKSFWHRRQVWLFHRRWTWTLPAPRQPKTRSGSVRGQVPPWQRRREHFGDQASVCKGKLRAVV